MQSGGGVVSYYFTNFPLSLGIEALWGLFMKWGKVVDVFVPSKKNKEGKAFGFVRFKEVLFPNELERRLDQIWVGTYKLRVNYTRFSRNKDMGGIQRVQQRKVLGEGQARQGNFQQPTKATSYVDVVKGSVGKKIWQKKGSKVVSDEWRGLNFEAKQEDVAWLNGCFVGCVNNPNAVHLLQDRILEEGVTNCWAQQG